MNTTCDLDEVRHVALQRFLEVAERVDGWEGGSMFGDYFTYQHIHSKFKITTFRWSSYINYLVDLDGESLFNEFSPQKNTRRYPKRKKDDKLTVAAQKQYDKDFAAFYAQPVMVAIKGIIKAIEDKACEERRLRILKDAEESCKRIQGALKETRSYAEVRDFDDPHCGLSDPPKRPWWRFW